eukprot:scaffold12897_cov29-Tisochrysis_lutea.AAC.7
MFSCILARSQPWANSHYFRACILQPTNPRPGSPVPVPGQGSCRNVSHLAPSPPPGGRSVPHQNQVFHT